MPPGLQKESGGGHVELLRVQTLLRQPQREPRPQEAPSCAAERGSQSCVSVREGGFRDLKVRTAKSSVTDTHGDMDSPGCAKKER